MSAKGKIAVRALLSLLSLILLLPSVSCKPLVFLPEASGEIADNNILPTEFSYVDGSDRPIAPSGQHGEIVEGDCLIYDDGYSLVRYHIRNDARTYVCANPLCRHGDASCPFFGRMECRYYRGKLFLLKRGQSDDGSSYRFYSCYDPESGEETILCRNNGSGNISIGSVLFDGDDFYYYEVIPSEEGPGTEPKQYRCFLNRYDLINGKTEKVLEFPSKNYDFLLTASDHKIVLCEAGKGLYYINADGSDSFEKHYFYFSDDPGFGYLMDCCQPVGDELFICEEKGDRSVFYKLSFTGEKETVAELSGAAADCFFTNDYVYFRIPGEKTIGKMGNGSASDQLFDLKVSVPGIYRMDYAGNTEEVFLEFPENRGYDTCSFAGDFTVFGNYIFARYVHYGRERKDVYGAEDYSGSLSGLMRIDITTKEIVYVSGKQ